MTPACERAEIGRMGSMDDWMTVPEIAAAHGVRPMTVRRWIHERRLRAAAIVHESGRTTLRVRRADFAAFRDARIRDTLRDDWER